MNKTSFTHILVLILTAAMLVAGCGDEESTDSAAQGESSISKEDAARANGKSDSGLDYCELFGWYNDQICDTFCAKPDPDCGSEETFVSFRTSSAGFCPPSVDCSSFIELHADGTLKVDRANEFPQGTIHEAKISNADLDDAIKTLASSDLIALLSPDESPCVQPSDISEFMVVETNKFKYQNLTTFCDKDPLPAVRSLLEKLVNSYLPPTSATFDSFRISSGGFCPPDIDCSSSVEIMGDGKMQVDKPNDLSFTIHEAQLSDADLAAANTVFTDAVLLELLSASEAPCPQPTDFSESMKVEVNGKTYRSLTTFCDDAALQAVRTLIADFKARYTPDPAPDFKRFRLSKSAGPCPPDMDCSGHIELLEDGTLKVDRFGELPSEIHEVNVSPEDLEAAIAVLTASALIDLLSLDEPPCVSPTDIFEHMELETREDTFSNSTTFCDDAALQTVRDTLNGLSDAYLPSGN